MRSQSRLLLRSLVLAGLALVPAAQGKVWVVDDTPGTGADFASIQAAINDGTVVDGDVLLVKPGNYASLDITNGKSLTIQADSGGVVSVFKPFDGVRVLNLASGECVRLRGLAMNQVTLSNCAGTIWVEACTITAQSQFDEEFHGLSVSSCSDVILIKSSILGGNGLDCADPGSDSVAGSGLSVSGGSTVTSYGCQFRGGLGGSERKISFNDPCFGQDGGAGVKSASVQDKLFFSDGDIRGGQCGFCEESPAFGCQCPAGGTGLAALGDVHVLDSALMGGPGRPAHPFFGGCADAPAGVAFTGMPEFLPGKALRATTPSPVRENDSLSLHVEGPPHVPVWLASSTAPQSSRRIELLRGIALLEPSAVHGLIFLGITSATGTIDKTIPLGTLPAGLESSLGFWQLVYMEAPLLPGGFKILKSPEDPKLFVLGQGSMIVELDESF